MDNEKRFRNNANVEKSLLKNKASEFDEGMEEGKSKKRKAEKMKFAMKMKMGMLEYRRARKGKDWVTSKDEYRT